MPLILYSITVVELSDLETKHLWIIHRQMMDTACVCFRYITSGVLIEAGNRFVMMAQNYISPNPVRIFSEHQAEILSRMQEWHKKSIGMMLGCGLVRNRT